MVPICTGSSQNLTKLFPTLGFSQTSPVLPHFHKWFFKWVLQLIWEVTSFHQGWIYVFKLLELMCLVETACIHVPAATGGFFLAAPESVNISKSQLGLSMNRGTCRRKLQDFPQGNRPLSALPRCYKQQENMQLCLDTLWPTLFLFCTIYCPLKPLLHYTYARTQFYQNIFCWDPHWPGSTGCATEEVTWRSRFIMLSNLPWSWGCHHPAAQLWLWPLRKLLSCGESLQNKTLGDKKSKNRDRAPEAGVINSTKIQEEELRLQSKCP